MSNPKYYATYCLMDDAEAGSNPFWHAFIIVSKQEDSKQPIEVKEAVGFYSQPNTDTNPLVKGIKYMIDLEIDLSGGHGELRREKMRHIDGNGIHGLTFDISEEKFNHLLKLFEERMAAEKAAIQETNDYYRRYGIEPNGQNRLIIEKSWADTDGREPRLKPFDINIELTTKGLDSKKSHDCKNYALEFLFETKIIDEETRDKILGNDFMHGLPRFNGLSTNPLRLVSTGEPYSYSPTSELTKYSRSWENKNKLFWATLPIFINSSKAEVTKINRQQMTIKKVLTQARALEAKLLHKINDIEVKTSKRQNTRNVEGFDQRKVVLERQLERVQSIYELFKNADENSVDSNLNRKLLEAENIFNVATLSLQPKKVDYSFMLRAYESISMRYALLSLLGLMVASSFITTPVGAAVAATAALFAGHKIYSFFKEDLKFIKMRYDYNYFFKQTENRSEILPQFERGVSSASA